MEDLKKQIDQNRLPKHIAIIMDGNGRWAKKVGKPRVYGHTQGVKTVRAITEAAADIGIKHLTLYAFSKENWSRPKFEVNALMSLLVETLRKEINTLKENNIRLTSIGDLDTLPKRTKNALLEGIESTKNNDLMNLNLAINYSGRWDIIEAVKNLYDDIHSGAIAKEEITESLFDKRLSTAGIPDPDLLIRTSGENRLSNYLLWQLAYSEMYFTDTHWPEFSPEDLIKAIIDYQVRERRFGKTSEQIIK